MSQPFQDILDLGDRGEWRAAADLLETKGPHRTYGNPRFADVFCAIWAQADRLRPNEPEWGSPDFYATAYWMKHYEITDRYRAALNCARRAMMLVRFAAGSGGQADDLLRTELRLQARLAREEVPCVPNT